MNISLKGRTPRVFWFNPDAEDAMADGPSRRGYHRPLRIGGFIRDLEGLPIFLARPDDIVVTQERPSQDWLERLKKHGFDLPEFEVLNESGRFPSGALIRDRKLSQLRPWAWCPQAEALFRSLSRNLPDKGETVRWGPEIRSLFSKSEQACAFRNYAGGKGTFVCQTEREIDDAIASIRARNSESAIVIKAPFASAGRGLRKLEKGENLQGSLRTNVLRILIQQGSLVLEPWQERVFDFSAQFEMEPDGLRRLGVIRQIVDGRGGYRASLVGPKFCRGLPSELASFLAREALPQYEPGSEAMRLLSSWFREVDYTGPVGVDSFVYRGPEGDLFHRTICEVNPRYTMGRLAWELSRKVAPGRWVRFEIARAADAPPAEAIRVTLNKAGLIEEGVFILNDPDRDPAYLALLEVTGDVKPPAS